MILTRIFSFFAIPGPTCCPILPSIFFVGDLKFHPLSMEDTVTFANSRYKFEVLARARLYIWH